MQAWFADYPELPATLPTVWRKILADKLDTLDVGQKNLLTRVSVGYLLRVYSFHDIVRIARGLPIMIEEWRKLRLALLADFHSVLAVKIMLMRCVTKGMLGWRLRVKDELQLAELPMNDRALFHSLDAMQLTPLLQLKLQSLPVETIPTVAQVKEECQALLADRSIIDFSNKFAQRKLRFIFGSQNFELQDATADLFAKAASTFYFVTPFLTELHRRNTVKRAIHNHGILMMQDYNSNNPRLVHDGTTWVNLVRSFGRTDTVSGQFEGISPLGGSSNGMREFTHTENRLAITDYLAKTDAVNSEILQLLMLEDDDFQSYVQQQIGKDKSIEEIQQSHERQRFFTMIARYLDIPKHRVQTVVQDMRNLLTR